MPQPGEARHLLLFDTTNAVLWAEEVAEAGAIAVEVVPAPAGSGAGCDRALVCGLPDGGSLEKLLGGAGVPFRRWR